MCESIELCAWSFVLGMVLCASLEARSLLQRTIANKLKAPSTKLFTDQICTEINAFTISALNSFR